MEKQGMSAKDRVWFVWLKVKALLGVGLVLRQPAWGLIEFAIGALVFAVGAAVGLKVLGTDLSNLFVAIGGALKLPPGGIGGTG